MVLVVVELVVCCGREVYRKVRCFFGSSKIRTATKPHKNLRAGLGCWLCVVGLEKGKSGDPECFDESRLTNASL